MKLYTFNQFINEETALQKAKKKLLKSSDKADRLDNNTQAAGEEIEMRKAKVDYEKDKEKLKNQIDSASDEGTKGQAKQDLKDVKAQWKSEKKKFKDRIYALKQSNK